ncbi:DUF6036 family nucleotidyltransferase [Mycolicibacterium sp. Y3]
MNRQELAHILRASCAIAKDTEILVLGSQAILGAYDDSELPESVILSREVDIAFLDDDDRRKADDVEGAIAIGEMSPFHHTHRVYAEGVHIDTAELPEGWRERLVTWTLQSSDPASPKFVEPHDLVVSKLAAGRGKDVVFAAALLDAGLVKLEVLTERAARLPASGDRVAAWLVAYRRRLAVTRPADGAATGSRVDEASGP